MERTPLTAEIANRGCSNCNRWVEHRFAAVLAANGVRQIHAWCTACGQRSEALAYAAVRMVGLDPLSVPIYRDNVGRYSHRPCEVKGCSDPHTEFHHFAPGAVFCGPARLPSGVQTTESDLWPTAYLCRGHHIEWHQRMSGYRWGAGQAA